MEAAYSSENLVHIYQNIQRHIQGHHNLHDRHHVNIRF